MWKFLMTWLVLSVKMSFAQHMRETGFVLVSLGPDGNNMGCSSECALADDCLAYATTAAEPCRMFDQEKDIQNFCSIGQITCYRKKMENEAHTETVPGGEDTQSTQDPTDGSRFLIAEVISAVVPFVEVTNTVTHSTPEPASVPRAVTTCVETIRKQGSSALWMSFYNKTLVLKYNMDQYQIMQNNYIDKSDRAVLYRDFPTDTNVLDAFKVGMRDLFTVEENEMVSQYWANFHVFERTTRTSLKKMFGSSAPTVVHAADTDMAEQRVYLLNGVDMYEFFISGSSPYWTFGFVREFSLTDPSGPFPLLAGTVPTNIQAMCIMTASTMVVFAGEEMHTYDVNNGVWTNRGVCHCGF